MPLSAGIFDKKRWKASSPPAEAPMPTIGMEVRGSAGSGETPGLVPATRFEAFLPLAALARCFVLGVRAMRTTAGFPAQANRRIGCPGDFRLRELGLLGTLGLAESTHKQGNRACKDCRVRASPADRRLRSLAASRSSLGLQPNFPLKSTDRS